MLWGTTEESFTEMKLHIDTAATCNTLSELSRHALHPNTAIEHSPYSPYLLYPNGDAKPMRPRGQIVLLCDREGRYETLLFQVLPNELMDCRPALLFRADSERLGLISIKPEKSSQ